MPASSLHVLGLVAEDEGRYDEAEALQEEALDAVPR